MQRTPSIVQLVFEPVDLLPQALAFQTVAVSLAFQVASQALVFALLAFQFRDQFFVRRCAPARLHAFVMPRVDRKYKVNLPRSRPSEQEPALTTR
jgi:hypothetical protein